MSVTVNELLLNSSTLLCCSYQVSCHLLLSLLLVGNSSHNSHFKVYLSRLDSLCYTGYFKCKTLKPHFLI